MTGEDEKLRKRREARRQKILASGGDRLSRIVGTFTNSHQDESKTHVSEISETTELSKDDAAAHASSISHISSDTSLITESFASESFASESEARSTESINLPQIKETSKAINDSGESFMEVSCKSEKNQVSTPVTSIDKIKYAHIPQSPSVARTPQKFAYATPADTSLDAALNTFPQEKSESKASLTANAPNQRVHKFFHYTGVISLVLYALYTVYCSESIEGMDYELSWLPLPLIELMSKLKLFTVEQVQVDLVDIAGFPLSVWSFFLTFEVVMTVIRVSQKQNQQPFSIPDEAKMVAESFGVSASSINTWSQVLCTVYSYTQILGAFSTDLLTFIFVFGFCVMISDFVL